MNDGVGWKIVMCPTHAAAFMVVEALQRYVDADAGTYDDDLHKTGVAALRTAGVPEVQP